MRSLFYSAFASVKIGMDILSDEGVVVNKLLGHGGLFTTPIVGQKLLAGALNIPIALMESAGEGGAWGIAVLAAYSLVKESGETLEQFLDNKIFAGSAVSTLDPDPADVKGFEEYLKRFKAALEVERTAVESIEEIKK